MVTDWMSCWLLDEIAVMANRLLYFSRDSVLFILTILGTIAVVVFPPPSSL